MIRRAVSVVGELLITAGVLTLLFVVWQVYWTDFTSGQAQAARVSALEDRWAAPAPAGTPAPAATATAPAADPPVDPVAVPAVGDPFAIVYVPRFGADYAVPVVEGTGTEELKEGMGHYPATAMPGQVGNFAVAGHRVTYGKPLNRIAELVEGDAVVVATRTQWLTYRVRSWEVVSPKQVSVIAPVPDQPGATPTRAWLTLTACHPMYSARERYVVFAELDSVQDRSAGEPSSLTPVGG
ncbi:class E sortase [Kineococcus sp. SYSU DK002]|uniref:class E sortase n=1 Tax=Kineococcus sp. SYSU DK002 TaxID=3383123 RepID=UPI003D7EC7B4